MHDLEKTERDILRDPVAKAAYLENELRHKIAKSFAEAMIRKKFPKFYYFRKLGVKQSQALRLLQKELGGDLNLYSICRAAIALDLEISIEIKPKFKSSAKINELNHSNYRG